MECAAHHQRDHSFGAAGLARFTRCGHGRDLTRNHHLARRIKVCRHDHTAVRDFGAGRGHVVARQPQHRSHGAGTIDTRLVHEFSAGMHQSDGILETNRTGGDTRGILAEAVARAPRRRNALGLDQPQRRHTMREQRGLGMPRLAQHVLGALPADPGQLEAQRLVGGLEHGARFRVTLSERSAHADGLGALAGKQEGELHDCGTTATAGS